ncbi:hypothetical protein FIBSPDRAFT_1037317 [Athelia psychrophila]|uniref:Protein arginine methyltransferase NDUFAF7 n=1 Tax=Athelia psychrophila TaxID=1759441 RepID=A0A166UJT6_9AGAM|nr:hypothetical protein FIBSPDRAFT_1037317 [Fibularhizoctonia sp. CBS 109695]
MLPRNIQSCMRLRLPRASTRIIRRYKSSVAAPALAPVTTIEKIILDNIKATGPISFASYMQFCLGHPTHGYYANPTQPVFGAKGDFITSPEISQVFGELVGVWLVSQWMAHIAKAKVEGKQRGKKTVRIVELGPGRGTLMADILRVISQFPATHAALTHVHLVDNSAYMCALQATTLQPLAQKCGVKLEWHDALEDVPAAPEEEDVYTMLVAHEFFDALPINLLERTDQGWHEVLIANNPPPSQPLSDAPSSDSNSSPTPTPTPTDTTPTSAEPTATEGIDARFRLVLTPAPTTQGTLLGLSSPRFTALPVGKRVEVSHAAFKAARKVGELLSGGGRVTEDGDADHMREGGRKARKGHGAGAGLVVDYGGDAAFDNSFRAFKDHALVDPFHRPGECDLTTNVDFAYIKEAFAGVPDVRSHGPLPQGAFLTRMGLHARMAALARVQPGRAGEIREAGERLVDEAGMGNEYKVLGITVEQDLGGGAEVWPFVDLGEPGKGEGVD